MGEQQQLSGTIVLIIIAVAVQACIMLVIIVKRQIMRFALRNKRGPHTHIGQGAPKVLRREIDRRLEFASFIKLEPQPDIQEEAGRLDSKNGYRTAAVVEMRQLENLIGLVNPNYHRPSGASQRSFLLSCLTGPLRGADSYLINQACDDYEHARHHFEEFAQEKFTIFQSRVDSLRQIIQANQSVLPDGGKSHESQNCVTTRRTHRTKKPPKERSVALFSKKRQDPAQHDSKLVLLTSANSPNCTAV